MNILLVEDEKPWLNSLEEMYRNALGKDGQIDLAANAEEAMAKLSKKCYDVLSLDINLGKSIEINEDRIRPNASGMDVLNKAKEEKRVKAVIVLSACSHDQDLVTIIPDEDKRIRVQMQMGQILEKMFPRRSTTFFKSPLYDVEAHISRWKEEISWAFLKQLVSGELLPPPYILHLGKIKTMQVTIRSAINGANTQSVGFRGNRTASLLFALAFREVVPQEFVAKLFDKDRRIGDLAAKSEWERERDEGKIDATTFQKRVSECVKRIRKFLATRRIDSKCVIKLVKGKGYTLAPDVVKVEGLNVNVLPAGWGPDNVRDPMKDEAGKGPLAESFFCDEQGDEGEWVSVEKCDGCDYRRKCKIWA